MNFEEYQNSLENFCIYPKTKAGDIIIYPFFGLGGEAGECLEWAKKIQRDKQGKIGEEESSKLLLELGDVLFYLSRICTEHGLSLDTVARTNILKLQSRKDRNKIHGSGDTR